MKLTKNYGLKKPEQTDFYDVVHENDNMDILDEKLNEASHYQGNISSEYDYQEGFVFCSDGDESVWKIPRALKVVYDAVRNLASNGVEKNKNRVDKMEQVISRASNTWIIPDYLKDAIHYVCGAGTPEENGYSADDYNDENGYDEPYLDVISGTVYHAIRTKDSPLTYGWVVKEQLASVQEELEKANWSDWKNIPVLAEINNGEIKYRENGYFYELYISVNVKKTTSWSTLTIATLPFAVSNMALYNMLVGGAYSYVAGTSKVGGVFVDITTASNAEGIGVFGHHIIPKI